MTLAQLQAFLAVLSTGTTKAASLQLGLSQPAISRRITELEDSLSLRLFIRAQTRLVPTREARFLEAHARVVVDKGNWIRRAAQELGKGNSSAILLSVAFPASLTADIVPRMIARFVEGHDKVRVELHTGPYDTIERMVLDDRAQLGFVRLPLRSDRLRATPLIEVPTVCVMPIDHRLASQARISLDELEGEPMVLLGHQRRPRTELSDAFAQTGLMPNVRVEAHSVASACALVKQGLGVTLVNELMARDHMHPGLTYRPIVEPLPHRFAFAVSADIPVTHVGEAFMDSFRTFIADYSIAASQDL